ncbi:unnamed protein product [Durusdinium trenchii]|uniref:Uncharacterized protein n=1 Tax=Durusdinium trenchii TaxID=1381693 RepID=A0ABP0LZV4_9DINO
MRKMYEGKKMGKFNSEKVVSVVPAALQGFEANYAHYSAARVMRGPPQTRPLFLRECGKVKAERRRGGRRAQGSLIDVAVREKGEVGCEICKANFRSLGRHRSVGRSGRTPNPRTSAKTVAERCSQGSVSVNSAVALCTKRSGVDSER